MPRERLEIADIFRAHGPAWRKARTGHVSLGQLKVMSAIETCRTAALGGHVAACQTCGHRHVAYNSCRNRHCPKCQGAVARVDDIDEWSPIGSNGRLYLQNIGRSSTVTVRWNGTVCDFDVPRPDDGAIIPDLGEFLCVPRAFQ